MSHVKTNLRLLPSSTDVYTNTEPATISNSDDIDFSIQFFALSQRFFLFSWLVLILGLGEKGCGMLVILR